MTEPSKLDETIDRLYVGIVMQGGDSENYGITPAEAKQQLSNLLAEASPKSFYEPGSDEDIAFKNALVSYQNNLRERGFLI